MFPFRNATVSEVAQTYTYVNTTSALANYTNGTDLITADYSLTKAEDAAAGHTSRIDYLGTLTNVTPGTTNKLTVTCVAWFEGSDPDTLNESAMDEVSNTLKFYVRTAA